MQTGFSLAQLADSDTAVSNGILRACVHCGFCLATCPTYVVLGDELDSPRGRIYLMKNMLESGAPASPTIVKHLDRCLTCLACMTTCPSSVHYMHLVDHARSHIAKTHRRPVLDRMLRAMLNFVLPHTHRFRIALELGRLARPFRSLLPARLKALLSLSGMPARSGSPDVGTFPAQGERAKRVALLAGCVQPALRPEINNATIRLLNRRGVEVIVPPDAGCCGALSHHLSKDESALGFAKANIDAWTREIETGGIDAILITGSGCGTMIKDYGHMLRTDSDYAAKAARISSLAKDISEFIAEIGIGNIITTPKIAVTYHSACSLQHGQGVNAQPRNLLRAAGFDVREVAEGHLCCGSAGIYNMLEPEISNELLKRKIGNIERSGGAFVATGNIGCLTQLARATSLPVVHTVELLDWATGGPPPRGLSPASAEPA